MHIIQYSLKPTGKLSAEKYSEVWGVESESRPDKIYTVAMTKKGTWSCACPRWTMNASRPDCKHIKCVKEFRIKGFRRGAEAEMPEQVEKALSRFSAVEV